MKFTLGRKLGLGFSGILILMILGAILTYVKTSTMKEVQNRALAIRVPSIEASKDLQRDLNQTQSKGRQVILIGNDPARWQATKPLFDEAWDDVG